MNYKWHYDKLITRAQNRSILPNEYKEKHHIVPRCMGGSDDAENLVYLLAREHMIAHLLLMKMNPKNMDLVTAVLKMSKQCELNSNGFEMARKRFSEMMKTEHNPMHKDNPESEKRRAALSKRQTENNVATRPEVQLKMSQIKKEYFKNNPGPNKGKTASVKTREKQAIAASKRTGKNSCRRKQYNLVSPEGKVYYCDGELMKTIKELNLSSAPLKKFKGSVVPQETREWYNTELRINTAGWLLEEI